jgi:hypothetical protein
MELNSSKSIVIIIIIVLFLYNFISKKQIEYKQDILEKELNKKIVNLNKLLEEKEIKEKKIKEKEKIVNVPSNIPPNIPPNIVDIRDANVTNNPLYPLYNRVERPVFDMLIHNNNLFNVRTRGSEDTYHPIGYAKDKQTNEVFYIMGRQRYRGSTQGDFYLIPLDTNSRLKINLLDSSGNQIIKDIYNLPNEINIKSGIFNGKSFDIEQLKNTDLISPYY